MASERYSWPIGRLRARRLHPLPRHLSLLLTANHLTITKPCQIQHPPPSACGKAPSAVCKNRVTKKVIKTLTKRTLASLAAKEFDKAATDIKAAASKIDKAGARRVLHPNTAARRKSKLARAQYAAIAKAQHA